MIKPHGVDDLLFEYFTDEAREWYDPLKPYTLLEYQWVRDNLELDGKYVIDAGCHHGNYSVVFKPAFVFAIDCNSEYLEYAHKNMELNNIRHWTFLATLKEKGLEIGVPADIYKIDIEGAEFQLLPNEIDNFPTVKTWIIEIHPKFGDPEIIADYFRERNFELLKVDRDRLIIREYLQNEKWNSHATLIARKMSYNAK